MRQFLSFVHLQGACGPELAAAIPKVAVNGGPCRPQILTSPQRRQLCAAFERTTPEGKRDYALTLCLLDLARRLTDGDFNARTGTLRVPAVKRGSERILPLHPSTVRALQSYQRQRQSHYPLAHHFFVGPLGRPLWMGAADGIFQGLVRGIPGNGARPRPRLYDLRHYADPRTMPTGVRASLLDARLTELLSIWDRHRRGIVLPGSQVL